MSDDDREPRHQRYRVNTRVMITAFLCLFFMLILVIFLHLYARRRLRRARRRAMTHQILVLGSSTAAAQAQPDQPNTGLDPAVIDALPVFVYRSLGGAGAGTGVECSVCLSGLEDGEAARVLPNCNHAFHKECIDMWLHSHSSCPVCRSDAEPKPPIEAAEAPAGPPPSAPPVDADNSTPVTAKVAGSSSSQRLSSFRRMLSREISSRRVQLSGQEEASSPVVDPEKQ